MMRKFIQQSAVTVCRLSKGSTQNRSTFTTFFRPLSNRRSHSLYTNNVAKANADEELLQSLQSEIKYELSQNSPNESFEAQRQTRQSSLGSFVIDSDPPDSQDLILRKQNDSEEIAITALLDPRLEEIVEGTEMQPRTVLMKVCVVKDGIAPVLQFDCRIKGLESPLIIEKVSYLHSTEALGSSKYLGPPFSDLDPQLQESFKEFLEDRGIDEKLSKFLTIHLHNKEQQQYVQWLHSVKLLIEKESKSI